MSLTEQTETETGTHDEVISIGDSPFGPAGCRCTFDEALAEFARDPLVWEIFRNGKLIASKADHLRLAWTDPRPAIGSPHAG